jgi:hypothetical protein
MILISRRRAGLAAATLLAAAAAGAQSFSRADADAMSAKIDRIVAAAEEPRPPSAPALVTSFTERETNAYIEFYGPEFLPSGVAKPRVRFGAGGRVAARAIVDLDAVRAARERSWLDPLAFVTGSVEVVATGAVATERGAGVVRFESATVGGIAIPKSVAQELLRFYTRSPERPGGFAFDEPFVLPPGVRSIAVDTGRATLVQ